MPLTDFRPELDHVDAAAAWRVAPEDEQRVAAELQIAARGALEALRRAFPAAVALHRVTERLADAPDLHSPPVLRPDRASALAAVDHFLTRTPQPSAAVTARGQLGRMNAFLWSRVEAWLEAGGEQTVSWDAVLRWIPDPWVAVDRLTRVLERETRASGAFESIAISLDLRPPGGAPWLREHTLEAWAELRGHLDAGTPRPLDLFLEAPGGGARPPKAVVAYGYELEGETALTLDVYDPSHGAVARRLRFDLGARVLGGADASDPPGAAVVRGFRCPAYQVARPPVFGLARILRFFGLEHLAWRRARHREQRRLGAGAPAMLPALPAAAPAPPAGGART